MAQSPPMIGAEVPTQLQPTLAPPPVGGDVRPPDFTTTNEPPSAAMRFTSELYNKSPLAPPVDLLSGAAKAVGLTGKGFHPLDALYGLATTVPKNIVKAQWDEAVKAAQKAKEAAHGGGALSASEAFGHGLAAILPLVGPAAANVGEHGAAGDWAGMAGGTLGLLMPFAVKYGLELKNAPDAAKADLLRRDATQIVSQRVLAPGNPRFKGTAETIAPQMLDRKLQGNRLQLQQFADEGMAAAADQIDAAIDSRGPASGNLIDVKPITAALQNRIDEFKVNGEVIPTATGKVTQLEALKKYLDTKVGNTATFSDLKRIRDEFYDAAHQAKGYQGQDVTVPDVGWAAREAGSAIREAFTKDRPELAQPNADYTFFKRLGDVLDPTLGRPKNVVASPSGITGGQSTAGAVIGTALAVGSKVPGLQGASALIASRLLPAIIEARNSPAWQLATAAQKMKLADAIEAGRSAAAESILLKIASLAPRTATSPPSFNPPRFTTGPR